MVPIVQTWALISQVRLRPRRDDATNELTDVVHASHGERTMILEVRHLRILTAIADHGTVSAATKHVYLTQSAISHQLIADCVR